MTAPRKVAIAILWLILFVLPMLFLFAGSGAVLPDSPLTRVYSSMVQSMGESYARLAFCSGWLIVNIALFWRFAICKRPLVQEPEGWPND